MASQEDHVKMFRSFIRANGNSENVCNLYWKRVRTFLAKHPEAMELDKDALKSLVDDYISAIPITSGIEVTATAVRYYWTMRFGERWCKRFDPKDYPTNEAIEKECSEFAVYLQSLGYLSARTVHDRTNKVKRFLYVMFDSGFDALVEHLEDVVFQVDFVEDLVALFVDDLTLSIHNVVVVEDVLSYAEVVALDLLLGGLDYLCEELALYRHTLLNFEGPHHVLQTVACEDTHEVVLN